MGLKSILRPVFGLKWKRLKEWREVLHEEDRVMTWRNYIHMAQEAFMAVVKPVPTSVYVRRLRVCQQCGLFDKGLKRCRPYTGSSQGCGCYVPYKAKSPSGCWINQGHPQQGWGPHR